jgi:hypothetical protein
MTVETIHLTDTADIPAAWRCIWQLSGGQKLHGKSLRPRPQEQNHPTKAAAEAHKLQLKNRFGDDVVCCITPVFITKKHLDEPACRLAEGAS